MDPNYYNRIDYKGPIENILRKVCEDFNLGSFKSYGLVPFGYEDFNVITTTDKGKFFVKIFGSYRTVEKCMRYVHVMELVYKNKINYPFLYESKFGGHYYSLKLNGIDLRLVVQEYIDGLNFIQLDEEPTEKEKEFIIQQTSIINKLNLKPKPVYDSWAIVNFANEFKERGKFLSKDLKEKVEKIFEEFIKTDIQKLPHCFVHGDIIRSNIMRDKNGKIWIIDFAVSNYYPRIIELSALICFNFFDPQKIENYAFNNGNFNNYQWLYQKSFIPPISFSTFY